MNYFVVGTNDMAAAVGFYDAFFASSGLQSFAPSERMHYWLGKDFAFAVAEPFDGAPASVGNGIMVGFDLGTRDEVQRLHALALERGALCEGAPGERGLKFSAYLRDLDGNKICLSAG